METTSGENEERLRAFLQSRAWLVFSWVRYAQTAFRVYEENWRDLRSHVDKLQDPRFTLPLHSIDHPARMDDYTLEFSRLLHNFLSAAHTLVDHTRIAVKKLYSGDPFENEFKQKLEQILLDSGIRQFVARLRNMVVPRQYCTAASHDILEFRRCSCNGLDLECPETQQGTEAGQTRIRQPPDADPLDPEVF